MTRTHQKMKTKKKKCISLYLGYHEIPDYKIPYNYSKMRKIYTDFSTVYTEYICIDWKYIKRDPPCEIKKLMQN